MESAVGRTTRIIGTGAAAVALALLPGVAAAEPPSSTPAGTGGGCAEAAKVVAGSAQDHERGSFGRFVASNAPIADENAFFFESFCTEDAQSE
jgi:hypothetical protein